MSDRVSLCSCALRLCACTGGACEVRRHAPRQAVVLVFAIDVSLPPLFLLVLSLSIYLVLDFVVLRRFIEHSTRPQQRCMTAMSQGLRSMSVSRINPSYHSLPSLFLALSCCGNTEKTMPAPFWQSSLTSQRIPWLRDSRWCLAVCSMIKRKRQRGECRNALPLHWRLHCAFPLCNPAPLCSACMHLACGWNVSSPCAAAAASQTRARRAPRSTSRVSSSAAAAPPRVPRSERTTRRKSRCNAIAVRVRCIVD